LNYNDAGTDKIFGQDRIDYDNKSNTMPVLGVKREYKKWAPIRQKTAE
jgi:hypothetical protein